MFASDLFQKNFDSIGQFVGFVVTDVVDGFRNPLHGAVRYSGVGGFDHFTAHVGEFGASPFSRISERSSQVVSKPVGSPSGPLSTSERSRRGRRSGISAALVAHL